MVGYIRQGRERVGLPLSWDTSSGWAVVPDAEMTTPRRGSPVRTAKGPVRREWAQGAERCLVGSWIHNSDA